jgi:hypothetical protein
MNTTTRKRGPGRGREVSLIERGKHCSRHEHKNSGKTAASQTRRAGVFGNRINQTWAVEIFVPSEC